MGVWPAAILVALALGAIIPLLPANPPAWLLPVAVLLVASTAGALLVSRAPALFDLRRLRLPGVLLASYYSFVAVPAVFVAAVRTGPNAINFLLAIESVLITFPAGVVLLGRSRAAPGRGQAARTGTHSLVAPAERVMGWLWAAWLAGSLALLALYLVLIRSVPLIEMIRHPGQEQSLELLREHSFKYFPAGLAYLLSWGRIFFLPYGGLMALAMSRVSPARRAWQARMAVSFVLAAALAAASTAKAPLIYVIIMFVALGHLLNPRRTLVRLIAVGVAALAFSVIIFLRVNGAAPLEAVGAFFERTFLTPADVAYYYFEVFPQVVAFQAGQSISLLTGALSGFIDVHFLDVANYVFLYIFPAGISTGTANAVFVASLWVDFGWFGVVVGPFAVALLIQALQSHIDGHRDVFTLSLHAFLVVPIGLGLLSTSVQVTLVTNGVLVGLVTALILRSLLPRGEAGRA